jgi:hypothetical protein
VTGTDGGRRDLLTSIDLIPQPGGGTAGPYVEADHNCPDLYRQAVLPTFELEMPPEEWEALKAEHAGVKQREEAGLPVDPPHPAFFRYGGEIVAEVEVRLNGPTWSWDGAKMPLSVSFDPGATGVRFHGLRRIELEAPPADKSRLRSRVGLAFLRDLGLPAQCANNARLQVNGTYQGLYSNLEPVDGELVRRVFPDSPGGDLWLYGSNAAGDGPLNWNRLQEFRDTQDFATTARMSDMSANLKEWAAEAAIPHGNGYWGLGQSHSLYDHPTRGFLFLPLGLAASFDWVPATADPVFWTGSWVDGPPSRFTSAMADEATLAAYLAALESVVAAYDPGKMMARVDLWSAQISQAAAEDPALGFSYQEHQQAVRQLRAYFASRVTFLKAWLGCRKQGGGDLDGDGHIWCRDCDDSNGATNQAAPEICGDNQDNNCSGRRDEACAPP